jgi:hypothetical protein
MRLSRTPIVAVCATALVALAVASAVATPITPTRDDEVIEVLPATSAGRSEDRQLRRRLAERPNDARLAAAVGERYLAQARDSGDPRFVGLALAALAAWPDPATTPNEILLLRATLEQYLHEFDASVAHLRVLLARPGSDANPQAWLTLATVLRVQGRYADSDVACRRVAAVVYASGCLAENAALRGETAAARRSLQDLLADTRLPPSTRGWLLTSLAELEDRDGHAGAADAAYRGVLHLGHDTYAAIAYADFLIAQKRPVEVLAVLKDETRTDPVLLRLAIAATRANAPGRERDVAEMRERIALANERPEAAVLHGREQAMFALAIERDAERALVLARGDVARQREPLDLLVFAEAARATGRSDAIEEARRLKASLGLHDRRIDAVL